MAVFIWQWTLCILLQCHSPIDRLCYYRIKRNYFCLKLLSMDIRYRRMPLLWCMCFLSSCSEYYCLMYAHIPCSLKYINVAMVTVLKNVTNVITAVGEMYLFNKHHDNRVWAALFLMVYRLANICLLSQKLLILQSISF